MSDAFLHAALIASQVLLGAGMLLCAWRIWRGPSAEDRVLGLDTLYVNAMLLMLTFGVRSTSRPRWSSRCSASSPPWRSPSSCCAAR